MLPINNDELLLVLEYTDAANKYDYDKLLDMRRVSQRWRDLISHMRRVSIIRIRTESIEMHDRHWACRTVPGGYAWFDSLDTRMLSDHWKVVFFCPFPDSHPRVDRVDHHPPLARAPVVVWVKGFCIWCADKQLHRQQRCCYFWYRRLPNAERARIVRRCIGRNRDTPRMHVLCPAEDTSGACWDNYPNCTWLVVFSRGGVCGGFGGFGGGDWHGRVRSGFGHRLPN